MPRTTPARRSPRRPALPTWHDLDQLMGNAQVVRHVMNLWPPFLAASIRGVVWKIQGNSGEEVSQLRVAEALASGPRLCDGRLLLSGASGSLYLKEIP